MFASLLLSAALSARQAESPAEQVLVQRPTAASAPNPETTKAPANVPTPPPPDRWLLMKALQGTWEGDLLDSNRLRLAGWTELAYTASTAARNNLPLGF